MANEKRKRSANWMASEKTLLVDLVSEHFLIIENKRTDGVTMKQKLAEWATISDKYNSQTMFCHRTMDNLKAQWESLKKATKKEASYKRMHLIQTGGGPSRPKIEDPLQERILSLITPSAVGLHNPYDNDNMTTLEHNTTESLPGGAHVNVIDTIPGPEVQTNLSTAPTAPSTGSTAIEDCLWNGNDFSVVLVPTPDSNPANPQTQVTMSNNGDSKPTMKTDCTMDWGDYTPKSLKTPVSKQLRQNREEIRKPVNAGKQLEWISKRRPQLTSSSLENLHQLKGTAVTMQMDHAAKEREEAKQLFEIQMEIQKEILKQEKLKTRIQILELRRIKKKIMLKYLCKISFIGYNKL